MSFHARISLTDDEDEDGEGPDLLDALDRQSGSESDSEEESDNEPPAQQKIVLDEDEAAMDTDALDHLGDFVSSLPVAVAGTKRKDPPEPTKEQEPSQKRRAVPKERTESGLVEGEFNLQNGIDSLLLNLIFCLLKGLW